MAVKTEAWDVTRLGGDYPHLTSLNKTLQDPRDGKIYMYGGMDPGEEDEIPKPYFHVCNTQTMEFTDLTNSLVYSPPGDPYSMHHLKRKSMPLPALTEPGITFLEVKGHPMVFLFGGHDTSEAIDGPTSKLIAIHTKHKEWYYVDFEVDQPGAKSPIARINPVLVGCNDRIYIFGGIKEFGDNWTHHRTYSIIEFLEQSHKCRWVALDVPYPREVPAGQAFGKGVPVHNGSMILLFPARQNQESKVDFHNNSFFYFLPINNTFQMANIKGDIPKRIHWYYACHFEPANSLSSNAPPSVFICTWIPYDAKYLSPEVWRYYVYPKDTIICLNLHKKLFDLGVNFRRFSLVGSNMYLMGQGGDASDGSDDGSGTDEGAMCDTYIRIPV